MEIEVGLLRLQSFRNLRDIGLQFCFVIQINLCNLTAIQEDCSRIAEIAVGLLRLQIFFNLHIRLVILLRVGKVA